MKRALSLFCLVVCCCFTLSASAFDAIVAFGDSLTDTGNEPAEPYLHYQGRWSNGPLWIEYLSVTLGFPYNASNNLAHSGAQTDDTYTQVNIYTPTNDISHTLFVVWAGGNDFLPGIQNLLVQRRRLGAVHELFGEQSFQRRREPPLQRRALHSGAEHGGCDHDSLAQQIAGLSANLSAKQSEDVQQQTFEVAHHTAGERIRTSRFTKPIFILAKKRF